MKGKLRDDARQYVSWHLITSLTRVWNCQGSEHLSQRFPHQKRTRAIVSLTSTLPDSGRYKNSFNTFLEKDLRLIKFFYAK
jgi:hypothetical protein